jgi:hypothetical protein
MVKPLLVEAMGKCTKGQDFASFGGLENSEEEHLLITITDRFTLRFQIPKIQVTGVN